MKEERKKEIHVPIVFVVLIISVVLSIFYNRQIIKHLDDIQLLIEEADQNVVNMNFGPGPDSYENSSLNITFKPGN